ncbi:PqiB family protein [Falsiroseomonas oryzae]|uniref:PqiB family protein n=1 Tax=Falsiroseomonas oryzae TaxID=2766473 RepID=UPI0022EB0CD4|nr:MlaD family protein [Roseomonas sp. MO-31]
MDSVHPEAVVKAKVGRSRRVSAIWAIPIVTVLISAYLVWHSYAQRGPTITITFRAADGLTAGQSQLRYRDVTIGTVEAIALADDLQRVTLTVRTTRAAEPLLTEHARFWVVKPRLFAGSISGLDTLLSGSYIQVSPSAPGGAARRDFVGLEVPPLLTSEDPGRTFRLRAERIGSINVGSPIFYRDLEVGQVLGWDLADMAEYVTIHGFIRAPFDRYVRENTRFWNASGVSVKLGAEGVQLQFESLRALLLGGIAFETPEGRLTGPAVASNAVFDLFDTKQAADDASFTHRVPVVSYFTDSIGGLARGAPVVFQGLRIGQVVDFELRYDAATNRLRIPVRYEIEPQRIATVEEAADRGPVENARLLVRQGLRARLASANLLTGQQQISLDFVPDAAAADITMEGEAIVFPTVPGQIASLIDQVNAVMARIDALPLQQIGENLNSTIAGVDALVRGPELAASLASLQATLAAAEDTVRRIDAAAAPTLRALPPLVNNLNSAVTQAGRLIASANRGYGDESQFRRDLDRMLEQITVAARSLRSLADTLNRNPEALVRGRATQGP